MKKRIISLILCAAMITGMLSGCDEGNSSDVMQSADSTTAASDTGDPAATGTSATVTQKPATSATTTKKPETTIAQTTTVTTTPVPETEPAPEPQPDTEDEYSDYYEDDEYPFYYDYVMGNHGFVEGNTIYNNNATYFYDIRENAQQYKVNSSAVLWYGANTGIASTEVYNPDDALDFALGHWDDGLDLCAPFISRCLRAGGISAFSSSSTGLCMQLINSKLGFGQFLPINEDRTVTLPDYATPGDVIQVYCPYEGMMIHSLMFNKNDADGNMMVYCHNFRNNGTTTFHIENLCYDDDVFVNEVFFFHFYSDEDKNKNLPKEVTSGDEEVLILEDQGYCLKEKYNRADAIEYAKNNMYDGIGMFGAIHLSDCLSAGGIPVYYAHGSAVLFQLLKSRLGTARNVTINDDGTIYLPENAKAGDACFIYCPYDGVMINSFLIAGEDSDGKMISYSYDLVNDGTKAFVVDESCIGCGTVLEEAVIYSFKD